MEGGFNRPGKQRVPPACRISRRSVHRPSGTHLERRFTLRRRPILFDPVTQAIECLPDPRFPRSFRSGRFTYDIPLRKGIYEMHLYFVEPRYGLGTAPQLPRRAGSSEF